MKNFLAIYTGSPKSENHKRWNELDSAARQKKEKEGMAAWGSWVETNKNSIVYQGSPLGKTKKIDAKGISDITNQMAAFTVVRAESYEIAAKMFIEHPHFTIFPGDSVEIMECLSIPGS